MKNFLRIHIVALLIALFTGCAYLDQHPGTIEDVTWAGTTTLLIADRDKAKSNAESLILAATALDAVDGDLTAEEVQTLILSKLPKDKPESVAAAGLIARLVRRLAPHDSPLVKSEIIREISAGVRSAATPYL